MGFNSWSTWTQQFGVWAQLSHGMWDLGSLTRDQTGVACVASWILNHLTTRKAQLLPSSPLPCATPLLPTFSKRMEKEPWVDQGLRQLGWDEEWPQTLLCASCTPGPHKCGLVASRRFYMFLILFFPSIQCYQATWRALKSWSGWIQSTLWLYHVLTDWYENLTNPLAP